MKLKGLAALSMTAAFTAASAFTSLAAGWVSTSQGWKYDWGNNSYCTNNWVHYKDHWFYFGSDQIMRTGWIQRDGTWYFAADSGELQGGLTKINGNVYYFNTSTCKMFTGVQAVDGHNYTFTENGTTPDAPYVYTEFNSNGTIKRGWKFGV